MTAIDIAAADQVFPNGVRALGPVTLRVREGESAPIARARVTEPALLVMDEPWGALDESTRARLFRELSELGAREALTILFVTHSIYEAVFVSTRVFVMSPRPGRIIDEVAIDEPH